MATDSHTPIVKFDDIPGQLPDGHVPDDADYDAVARSTIDQLNGLREIDFAPYMIWRDLLSLTDTFRTFYSIARVLATLKKLGQGKNRSSFQLTGVKPLLVASPGCSWLDIEINFTTEEDGLLGHCAGVISVVPDAQGNWKIWMLRTWLERFEGHGDPDHLEPIAQTQVTNGIDHAKSEDASQKIDQRLYDAIVIGGGQGGLGAAGRMQALGISYVMFDERPQIGDSWAERYDSLKWHTIREYGNLPFDRTWSADEEDLLPIKRIGAGYKAYVERYGINAQPGTKVDSADWDATDRVWTIHTSGKHGNQEWKSKNLVTAIGPGHKTPVVPDWASPEKIQVSGFKGTIIHSVNYHNANTFAGLRGIVVGTANTAHDVAEDMANAGMHTTMIQRSPTFVMPGEWLVHIQSTHYNRDKPTATADREHATQPYKILREITRRGITGLVAADSARFDQLEAAGFRVNRASDLFDHLCVRFGGHYVDIGSCARIVKGEIKVRSGPVRGLTPTGLAFTDGDEVPADVIVLATGFDHDFRRDAAELVGWDVAIQMDDFWGPDAEGEMRGFARLAGHPNLYYFGGETRVARFYSRFLALQIQKQLLGWPLRPYLEGTTRPSN